MRGAIMVHTRYTALFMGILVRFWCRFGADLVQKIMVQTWCKKKESRLFGAAFLLFVKFIEPERAEAVRDHVGRMHAGAVGGGDQASAQHGCTASGGEGCRQRGGDDGG